MNAPIIIRIQDMVPVKRTPSLSNIIPPNISMKRNTLNQQYDQLKIPNSELVHCICSSNIVIRGDMASVRKYPHIIVNETIKSAIHRAEVLSLSFFLIISVVIYYCILITSNRSRKCTYFIFFGSPLRFVFYNKNIDI